MSGGPLHRLANRMRNYAAAPRADLAQMANELDAANLTPPPFVRDPLNWEGRAAEEWQAGSPRRTFMLVETNPGWVQVGTDVLRGLLTEAGYTKAGDL